MIESFCASRFVGRQAATLIGHRGTFANIFRLDHFLGELNRPPENLAMMYEE
jgi:hypothetical protein